MDINNQNNNASEADNYYDTIYRKSWSRRTSGFMAGATVAGISGAAGGVVASFIPYALGALHVAGAAAVALPAAATVLSTAALFATVAGALGVVIGADVGSNSGAVAAGLEVKEKREGRTIAGDAMQPLQPEAKPKLFNWKTSLVVAGMFAVVGVLTALSPITSSIVVSALGLKAASTAAIVATAAMYAVLGSTLGINFPVMTNKLGNFYSKILSGKAFEKEVAVDAPYQQQQPMSTVMEAPVMEDNSRNPKSFAADQRRFAIENIVNKTDERGTVITR